jgi:predicted N-acetyltransferase YhbS
MPPEFRPYRPYLDSPHVSAFLTRTYPPDDRHFNWDRSRWEYMVYSGMDGREEDLSPVGLWWVGERVVAVVTHEGRLGEAYFGLDADYPQLKAEMLCYAETHLCEVRDGRRHLTIYVHDWDPEMEALAAAAGFVKPTDEPQWTSRFLMPKVFPPVPVPDGYTLTDRAHRDDLVLINRVLWRGFNHEGPPPEVHVAPRECVEKAPLYRPELVVMAVAPEGHFVSYCGVWYAPALRLAYVEPVATDPDYRRRGLGRAVVLEALRRAHALGATRALVGSDQPFYLSFGFQRHFCYYPWRRTW